MSSDVNLTNKDPEHRGPGRKPKWKEPPPSDTIVPANCPWKIGQKVEACDTHGNWYPAKILDIKDMKLLIHFQRWSSRFDEWFDIDSNLIRKIMESKKNDNLNEFNVNDEVLARWSDGKFYPARIIKLFNDKISCHVWFYDGYKKKVKFNTIEKLPPDYAGDRLPPKPQPKETFAVVDPSNHNQFVCDICKKGFRKESLLTQHKKHYHNIVEGTSKEESSIQTPKQPIAKDSEIKDEVKVETVDKVKQHKITVKVEYPSGDEQQNEAALLPGESPALDVSETVKRKRKSKDAKRPHKTYSPVTVAKKIKTETNIIPPSCNPYFYYYEAKSTKKLPKTNFTLPFNVENCQDIIELHENDNIDEIVKCICPLREENGLMVQCELCLSWQHAQCMGFAKADDIPAEGYFCSFCRNPPKAFKSQRNSYQLNHWIKNALDPVFLPSNFTPIIIESSIPLLAPISHADQSKIMSKQSESSAPQNSYGSSHMMTPSGSSSLFESYFPNANSTSFPNQSTITTTTMAANHNAISSVSDSNKASAISLGPFMGASLPTSKVNSEFVLPSSSSLFPSNFMDDEDTKEDKKSFILHDFTNHSLNHNSNLNLDDDHMDNYIDTKLKSEYFDDAKNDENNNITNQVKAANMLSSALLDIVNNLHALNYKITQEKNGASSEILEKQQKLKENLTIIESKLEKLEKEIELKETYAIHTSSSTLTATSPENFGFSDINNGTGLSSQTTLSHKTSFPSSMFESSHSPSSDHLTFASSNTFETNPTLSSMNMSSLPISSTMDSCKFFPSLSNSKFASTTLTSETSLASLHLKNDLSQAHKPIPLSLQPSTQVSAKQDLARLYIPSGASSTSTDEQEIIENQRPSMTHEYLPITSSDADLKLEVSYHYKDLSSARTIVLSLK